MKKVVKVTSITDKESGDVIEITRNTTIEPKKVKCGHRILRTIVTDEFAIVTKLVVTKR